ncbi:MAG: riboflavin synthase [Oligoflexia bacterium]|nr:riboflavin synthase [Oligoflexia bacterium]
MFTGLIERTGKVADAGKGAVHINTGRDFGSSIGDSVSVDGVCLTVAESASDILGFDVSDESLSLTTLAGLKAGTVVNLERALMTGSRMHGHFVTGHVDIIGVVEKVERKVRSMDVVIGFNDDGIMHNFLAKKGSVAVDGVSLTVNEIISKNSFRLTLIPHTIKNTGLFDIKKGRKVNIEFDVLAKYIYGMVKKGQENSSLTEEKLRSLGYVL